MKKEISGYNYIDEPINELLNNLPIEDKAKYLLLFKHLYSAGVKEGIRLEKNNYEKIN
jgi:hypothetical protein